MGTFKQDADAILKLANGGVLNNSEPGTSRDFVMFLMLQQRDFLMEANIRKTEKTAMPEASYYSEYTSIPLQWDAAQEIMVLNLPNGLPVDVDNGMGISINPTKGSGGYFVWAPKDWCDINPEIAWAEGNYVYEFRKGRIVFPNMPKDAVKAVRVDVIETGTLNPDAPLPMPARYSKIVQAEVLNLLGHGRRDLKTDYKAEDGK